MDDPARQPDTHEVKGASGQDRRERGDRSPGVTAPRTLEPEPLFPVDPRASELLGELAGVNRFSRVLIALMMAGVSVLMFLIAGVLWRSGSWIGVLVLVVIVEPLAVFLALGAATCAFPKGPVGRAFGYMLPRAWRIVILVLGVIAVLVVAGIGSAFFLLARRP